MVIRSLLVAVLLVCSAWFVYGGATTEVERPAGLSELPVVLGHWEGRDEPPFDPETLRVLGVDEYVNRTYVAGHGGAARGVGVYVGYYASQREGDAIHSPLNCLPGTGWQPVSRSRLAMPAGSSASFDANRLVVQKGRDRQLVVYWYEGRGRRVASEYVNKVLLISDAVRFNRTDGALVRLMTPLGGTEQESDRHILEFAAVFQQALDRVLPGLAEDTP